MYYSIVQLLCYNMYINRNEEGFTLRLLIQLYYQNEEGFTLRW